MAVVGAFLAILLLRNLTGGRSTLTGPNNPKDDFRVLCRATMDTLESSTSGRPSEGEQRFQNSRTQGDLVNIARGRSQFAPIAARWLAIQTNAVGSIQQGGGAAVDLLNIWLEDKSAPSRSQETDSRRPRKKDGIDPEVLKGFANLFQQGLNVRELLAQRREIQAQLLHIAPQFTGTTEAKSSISIRFLEAEPEGFDKVFGNPHSGSGKQRITLKQDSNMTLRNCVIAVRLSQPREQDLLFCYFVDQWPSGSELQTDYSTGLLGDSDIDIDRVSVTIHSDDFAPQTHGLRRRGQAWPYFR